MARSVETQREVIEGLKRPFKVVAFVVVAGVSLHFLYTAVTEGETSAISLLRFGGTLLAVAVGASVALWLLRMLYRLVYERLPGFWRRLMRGLAQVASGLWFGFLGYLIGILWSQDEAEKAMGLAAFGVVFLVHAFYEGYRQGFREQ